MKSITVIVPAYNCENTITRCINSLLNQTYISYEILAVNDGSTDDTLTQLEKFKSKIRIISYEHNRGVSFARNIGIENSKTKYLSFVDADDYVGPNFLKHLIMGITEKNVDLSICGVNYIGNGKRMSTNFHDVQVSSKTLLQKILDINGVKGYLCNKLWKRSIILKAHLRLNENLNLSEDLLFTINYLQNCNRINIISHNDYFYVEYLNSLSHQAYSRKEKSQITKPLLDNIFVLRYIFNIYNKLEYKEGKISALAFIAIDYITMAREYKINRISITSDLTKKIKKYKHYIFLTKNLSIKGKIKYCLILISLGL